MNENVKLFLQKLSEDAELQEKMKAITDPEVAYALVSSVQGGFTKEEFIETMQQIKAHLDNGELSDADLANIAGGDGKDAMIGAGVGIFGASGIFLIAWIAA